MWFAGVPGDVFRFYAELRQHNDREWWQEHRWMYDDIVLPTAKALISELDSRWRPVTIYRPYRNIRFSPDKRPYKTAIGIVGEDIDGVPHYVQFSGLGMMVARGFHQLSGDQLLRMYDAIHEDDDLTLAEAMRDTESRGVSISTWDRLIRAPRGFSNEHRRVEMLRWGGITAGRSWPPDHGWLSTRRVISMIQQTWEAADPLMGWLIKHVGAPEL